MPIQPNQPNSIQEIHNFSNEISRRVQRLDNLSLKDILSTTDFLLRKTPLAGGVYENTGTFVNDLLKVNVDDVNPVLKDLAKELNYVMSTWFNDPAVLCCLIQGIWTSYAMSDTRKDQSLSFSLTDMGFITFLDHFIAFIDLVVIMISIEFKSFSILIPDISREILNAAIGALLLVLQQTVYAVKESLLSSLFAWMKNGINNDDYIWSKCLPLNQLFKVLERYIGDFGLFAKLFSKIKGHVSGEVSKFSFFKDGEFTLKTRDLEFLYWFKDLLIKLKSASINFDLCVSYDYVPSRDEKDGGGEPQTRPEPAGGGLGKRNNDPYPSSEPSREKFIFTDDGTILVDKQALIKNPIPLLTNDSIRNFLGQYYGYPNEIIDNILTRTTSEDSIQGSNINSRNLSNITADCPNTPDPEAILKWALSIRDREK